VVLMASHKLPRGAAKKLLPACAGRCIAITSLHNNCAHATDCLRCYH
jgi:hypothetical protein